MALWVACGLWRNAGAGVGTSDPPIGRLAVPGAPDGIAAGIRRTLTWPALRSMSRISPLSTLGWPAWAQPVAASRATNGKMPGLLKEDLCATSNRRYKLQGHIVGLLRHGSNIIIAVALSL